MPIPDSERARLTAIGVATPAEWAHWEAMFELHAPRDARDRRRGLKEFQKAVDAEVERARAYAEWRPKLDAFAVERRLARPAPTQEDLDSADRARLDILRGLMVRAREELPGAFSLPRQVALVGTTPVGLIAAAEVFADAQAVALLIEEARGWFDRLPRKPEPLAWCASFEFDVQVGLPRLRPGAKQTRSESESHERRLAALPPIPPGAEAWIVTRSVILGPLSGHGGSDVWLWDGEVARFHAEWDYWLA